MTMTQVKELLLTQVEKKNNFCSHFQFPIYKIKINKKEKHFHDIHTFLTVLQIYIYILF